MEIKQSVAFKVPVRLLNSTTGAGVTGKIWSDVTVYLQKQAGASAVKTLAGASEFVEPDATNFPGVYDLLLASGDPDTLGLLKYSVACSGCDTYIGLVEVVAYLESDTFAAVSGIGTAGGAAVNVDPATDNAGGGISGVTSGTTKVGTEAGTFANVSNVNGVYHVITHSGNAIDWVYQFLTGGGTQPVTAVWTGYLASANDTITFYAWNHVGAAWEIIGTQVGQGGTTNVVKTMTLYARHSGTSAAEKGKVYIRAACSGMTSPVLNTDQLYVSYAITSRTVGYDGGAVWVDTVGGTAGTESYVNGTADNPVLTWADALTIASNVGLTIFKFVNGSSVTLSGDSTGYTFIGPAQIALNGQIIDNCLFDTHCTLSGVGVGSGIVVQDGTLGTVTLPGGDFDGCRLNGPVTLIASEEYTFQGGCSDGAPTSDGRVIYAANAQVAFRDFSGQLRFEAHAATNETLFAGRGRITLHTDCTGGTLTTRGFVGLVDNVVGGFVVAGGTINQDERFTKSQLEAWQLETGVASVTGAVGSVTGLTPGNLDATVSSRAPASTAMDKTVWTDPKAAFIDAAISSRLASAGYTAPDNAGIAAIQAKTDNLPANPADVSDIPTAAENADAMLDAAQADHLDAGSIGKSISDASDASDAASVAAAILSTAVPGAFAAGTVGYKIGNYLPPTGAGALAVVLHTRDTGLVTVPSVLLYVYDSANTTLIALVTTGAADGNATVNLDAGTYKVRPFKTGHTATTPQTIVVAGAGTQNITIDVFVAPVASAPGLCMVYGTIYGPGGAVAVGIPITFSAVTPEGGYSGEAVTATTDDDGYFEIELAQGLDVYVQSNELGLDTTKAVPAAASQDFSTW